MRPAKISTLTAFLFIFSTAFSHLHGGESGWHEIAAGFSYKKIAIEPASEEKGRPQSKVHLVKIDPSRFKLQVITAAELGAKNFDAKTVSKRTGAILAINGGFFTPEYSSLGLLMNNGRVMNKFKWTSWWHIFQVKDGAPSVITKQEFLPESGIEMAIEAGPRALINGEVAQKLKSDIAERTIIGVTADGRIVIAVTDDYPAPVAIIATLLKQNGCTDALNLDGGGSTQLYAKFKGFELDVPGYSLVANGIGVYPR